MTGTRNKTLREEIEELWVGLNTDTQPAGRTPTLQRLRAILDRTANESTARPGSHLREALEKIIHRSGDGSGLRSIALLALAKPDPEPDPHEGERRLKDNPPKVEQRVQFYDPTSGWYYDEYNSDCGYPSDYWREQPPPPVPPFEPRHLAIGGLDGNAFAIEQVSIDRFNIAEANYMTLADLAIYYKYLAERLKEAGR